jgi:hypothetical protein
MPSPDYKGNNNPSLTDSKGRERKGGGRWRGKEREGEREGGKRRERERGDQ